MEAHNYNNRRSNIQPVVNQNMGQSQSPAIQASVSISTGSK